DADLNFTLRIENVELGDYQRIDAVDHLGVTEHGEIEPAAPSRTSRDSAEFIAAFADFLRFQVGHFRRKGAASHACGIRLGDTNDVLNSCGRHTHASGRAAGSSA